MRSGLLSENSPSLDSGTLGSCFKVFSSHPIKIPLDQETKTVVQVGQPCESNEDVFAFSQSGYVTGRLVPSLKG